LFIDIGLYPNRQRLLLPNDSSTKSNLFQDDNQTMKQIGIKSDDSIQIKDLGPQISWRTVFMSEYAGPLLIHQLLFGWYCSKVGLLQILAYTLISFHYAKRLWESWYVHKFSHETMPFGNLFKNCAHYWLLGGLWMANEIYSKPASASTTYSSLSAKSLATTILLVSGFIAAELGNFYSHVILARIRSKSDNAQKRAIPRGFAFEWVSCANYMFESLAWLLFAILVNNKSSWIFWILSTGQMYIWAKKKHLRYLKEFPNYPKNRKAMFPFLA